MFKNKAFEEYLNPSDETDKDFDVPRFTYKNSAKPKVTTMQD